MVFKHKSMKACSQADLIGQLREKRKTINGQCIPEDLTLAELEAMLDSSDMQAVVIACTAVFTASNRLHAA